ncbi:hypothetical protein EV199_2261 [Pseudobacter ginsenosidimutans]|uniref:Uncharacterized protein n=1 Tax=Pseudobacter ginsenosidimutans TaxID=661488 RepID=A0A4Q7N5P7_9BACT|nr:hypothetical protein EV199_2261 [Pseudobacter ginsenosidimutans]
MEVKKNPIKYCYAITASLTTEMKKKINEIRK